MGRAYFNLSEFPTTRGYMNEYIRLMEKSEQAVDMAIATKDVYLQLFYLNVAKGLEEKARALLVGEVC